MSDSTTNLDLIATSQASKEVTANALFDAASPNVIFGRRANTAAALTWGYYGGVCILAAGPTKIANGTLTLTDATTNYIEADTTTGAVSVNTTGWSTGTLHLYEVVTASGVVSSYTDWRGRVIGAEGSAQLDARDVANRDRTNHTGTQLADTISDFSTAVANNTTNKLDSSSYTAADVLAKIKTVDGAGSGLDADTLDGLDSTAFQSADPLIQMNLAVVSTDRTIPANYNAYSAGPLEISEGTTITVEDDANWSII